MGALLSACNIKNNNMNSTPRRVIHMACDGDQHIYQKGIGARSPREFLTISDMELYHEYDKQAVNNLTRMEWC